MPEVAEVCPPLPCSLCNMYGTVLHMTLEPIPDPTWWELVAHWRIRAKMTKAELAEICGISRTHLYRIENGEYHATPEQMEAVEAALRARISAQKAEAAA